MEEQARPALPDRSVLKTLASLSSSYRTAQRERIRLGNRLKARDESSDRLQVSAEARMFALWRDVETRVEWQIGSLVALENSELFSALLGLKCIGPLMSAQLLGPVDIEKADTVSALWRYCGYGIGKGGKIDRMKKGQSLVYNSQVKTTCRIISASFLKFRSPYAALYYEAKSHYLVTRPYWAAIHAHVSSMRWMMKRFLVHLWLTWRTLAELPITRPYNGLVPDRPADYGWPDLESRYLYHDD